MEKIFFILERIYRMTKIPVRYMDKTGEITIARAHCIFPVTNSITILRSRLCALLSRQSKSIRASSLYYSIMPVVGLWVMA
jgi:hypothetical protein